MAFLAHCSDHSTNMEISFRNERVLSFISNFTEIVIHLVTFVDGVSDLIYSFDQDHPQSLHDHRVSRDLQGIEDHEYKQ